MNDHDNHADASQGLFNVRPDITNEKALVHASEFLQSATALAYDYIAKLDDAQRQKAFGVIQLIEDAQLLVNMVLEREAPSAK
ncbi:DUF3077 domain-containing protein [Pseudomonas sp. S3E17]|uniref:DUF6124 family protein n=1 Tax=Pseudomonas sp. S3E17 TaxID=2817893 RepID=UPI00209EE27F|nr:DUF3077 domain-containing protein [Pseudomonas sp. S3E17]MCP1463332.1 hypothetical protein [Pseudomonas sp. S3E17]